MYFYCFFSFEYFDLYDHYAACWVTLKVDQNPGFKQQLLANSNETFYEATHNHKYGAGFSIAESRAGNIRVKQGYRNLKGKIYKNIIANYLQEIKVSMKVLIISDSRGWPIQNQFVVIGDNPRHAHLPRCHYFSGNKICDS